MKIAYPVTDYIPASLLTANGDIISRYNGNIINFGASSFGLTYRHSGTGLNLGTIAITGIMNQYFKGKNVSANAVFEALALRDTGIVIAGLTRNAGGDQVIATVGFQPSVVIFFATDQTGANQNWSVGFDNLTARYCMFNYDNGTLHAVGNTDSIYIRRGAGNLLVGEISAVGADGFTITWTLTGVCALSGMYLCLP